MTTSPKLGIPFLSQQQAEPEVKHNEALLCMQALLSGAEGISDVPPGSPVDGDVWIIGDTPSGVWTGKANKLTIYFSGMWIFLPGVDDDGADIPMGDDQIGMSVWQKDISELVIWLGGSLGWTAEAGAVGLFLEKARNLSDLANAATARTNLGVAIGSNVEAWDADLDALAALATTGIVARTGAATYVPRTITGSGGVTVTNGDGVAGAPAITLSASGGPYVLKSGDTMTGPLISAVGSSSAPGFAWAGDTTTGLYWSSAGLTGWGSAGVAIGTLGSTGVAISIAGGSSATVSVAGEGTTQNTTRRFSADSAAAIYTAVKGRGTIASPARPSLNDQLMNINASAIGTDGSATATVAARIQAILIETGTVSPTVLGAEWRIIASAIGSASLTEIARLNVANGLQMFGANTVIDANRNHQLRSYTLATLPTATAGLLIYCSDLGGGGGELAADGTNWKRRTPGYETIGDAANNFVMLTNAAVQEETVALTANRITTLKATNAYKGAVYTFVRSGLGAFTRAFVDDASSTTLYTSASLTSETISFIFNGTNWRLMQHSLL